MKPWKPCTRSARLNQSSYCKGGLGQAHERAELISAAHGTADLMVVSYGLCRRHRASRYPTHAE